jgi:ribosomal protein S1
MRLSRDRSAAVGRVLNAATDNFVKLATASGLNPATDFREAFLKNVDFSGCDLNGFDFTGSQIIECQFADCTIGDAVFDHAQFSMTDLSRARDWKARNSTHPIQYVKWSPENYYEQPTSSKTIGKVIGFDGSVAIVDVGGGLCRRFLSQGLQPLLERRAVSAGDTIALPEDVVEASPPYFYDTDEEGAPLTREDVVRAFENREMIRGMIYRAVKGGFLVNIATFKAFLPGSQVDRYKYQNIAELMNDPQPFLVVGIGGIYPDDIVVSRLAAIELAEAEMRAALVRDCYVGQQVAGNITAIVPYGAFVDIGGIIGLLPRKELRYRRKITNHDAQEIGAQITAMITEVDVDKAEIILSVKPFLDDPWEDIDFHPGQIVVGTVSSIVPYGAFIVLGRFTGLLHNSEIGFDKKAIAQDMFEVGEEITLVIIDLDVEKQRISLSRKALLRDPWLDVKAKYPVHGRVAGRVDRIVHFGAFIELEPGVVGLVHQSAMGWQPIDPKQGFAVEKGSGNEVTVLVIDMDPEQRRMSLSFDPSNDPHVAFGAIYPPGSTVEGRLLSVQDGLVQIELPLGLRGSLAGGAEAGFESLSLEPENLKWVVVEVDATAGKIVLSRPPALVEGTTHSE